MRFLALMLTMGGLSPLVAESCFPLSLQCLETPCYIQLNDQEPLKSVTPWQTQCLDSGSHWVHLQPTSPAWSGARWEWKTQQGSRYGIVHRPFMRVGTLALHRGAPHQPLLLTESLFQEHHRWGLGYGFSPHWTGIAYLQWPFTSLKPSGWSTEILTYTMNQSLALSFQWSYYRQHPSFLLGTRLGHGVKITQEWQKVLGSFHGRERMSLDWPQGLLSMDLGAGYSWSHFSPEGGARALVPLDPSPHPKLPLSLAPYIRLGFWSPIHWGMTLEGSAGGWPHSQAIHFQVNIQYRPAFPYAPPPKPLMTPRSTDTAWLADIHTIQGISSREAFSPRYRTVLPLKKHWRTHMRDLAHDSGKTSPICKNNERLYFGLCVPPSNTEWMLLEKNAPNKTIERMTLPHIPQNAFLFPELTESIPITRLEMGSLRPWHPIIPPHSEE